MAQDKKYKRIVLKGCVIDGENCSPHDEVKLSLADCRYCDGAGITADPNSDDGKELISSLPKKAAKSKK